MGYRKLRRSAAVLLAAMSLGLVSTSAARTVEVENAVGVPSQRQNLEVWTVNIHRMKDANWRAIGDRMAASPLLPDIILVQDIANTDFSGGTPNGTRDSEEFRTMLNNKLGVFYRYAHSDDLKEGPNVGNTMVLWRDARFDPTRETMDRWYSLTSTCTGVAANNRKQIAVRLWDLEQTRWVVAASVHFSPDGGYKPCTYRNLRQANNRVEALSPVRRLTLLGGDLNIRPDDPASGSTAAEDPAYGQEANPDCWYRWTSALHTNTTDAEGNYCDVARDAGTDTYYDTAWVENGKTNPSPGMCPQWTHTKKGATSGTACTDLDGDGLLDRTRIDYVWVRWEDPEGNPRNFTQVEAEAIIDTASVDETANVDDAATRYSDHRAVRATVRWCLPTEVC